MQWEKQREGGRHKGFTLVEVMVALVLVFMALAGAYLVVIHAARLSRSARDHYVATNLGRSRLERARNYEYSDLYLLAEDNLVVDEHGVPAAEGWFRRSSAVNTNYAPSLTEIIVTVQIRSRRNLQFGAEAEEISSLFTEYLVPQ
ncbi:MAG: prepilin-type N-terminal cleavage/methylation domain-containing protein [Verrucomicrobia bacterium]|nr:prepilin-type N-terminal cleavage/methylation domain-containing protein [Verrucomicrobiota bacterium]